MEKKINIIQWITLGLVIISWLVIPMVTEYKRKQAEIGIWRHTAMSDAHRNLATAINELHKYTTELASKYHCDVNDVLGEMSDEELNTANRFVLQTNTELAIMYMLMLDNKYKMIRDAIKPKQKINLIKCRNDLLVAMRQSQFPDTNFDSNDIRSFEYLRRN